MTIHPTVVTVRNGVVSYDDMQIDVGDNPINFSGRITLELESTDVRVSSTSGRISVKGTRIDEIWLNTISGYISLEGGVAPGGDVEVNTVSGRIDLTLPEKMNADYSLRSMTGSIDFEDYADDAGLGIKDISYRKNGHLEISFSVGDGRGSVEANTTSGSINLITE